MNELELDFAINHYRLQDDLIYASEGWDVFPTDINYITGLSIGVQKKQLDYKSLRVAKIYYLSHDPNSGERLSKPIDLVLEKYFYSYSSTGEFIAQNKQAYFYLNDGSIYWDKFKLLPKDLNTPEQKERVISNRRAAAFPYLKGRAREIDLATNNFYNLSAKIEDFFEKFYVLKGKYVESGSLKINNSIQSILDAESSSSDWLKTEIPIGVDPTTEKPIMAVTGKIIQSVLVDAVTDVTPDEIDNFLKSF